LPVVRPDDHGVAPDRGALSVGRAARLQHEVRRPLVWREVSLERYPLPVRRARGGVERLRRDSALHLATTDGHAEVDGGLGRTLSRDAGRDDQPPTSRNLDLQHDAARRIGGEARPDHGADLDGAPHTLPHPGRSMATDRGLSERGAGGGDQVHRTRLPAAARHDERRSQASDDHPSDRIQGRTSPRRQATHPGRTRGSADRGESRSSRTGRSRACPGLATAAIAPGPAQRRPGWKPPPTSIQDLTPGTRATSSPPTSAGSSGPDRPAPAG
jgi:hypothetical protein